MTLSSPTPRSIGAIGIALVWTGLTFGAALTPSAVEARGSAPYYSVQLAAPAAEARAIIGNVVWQCDGATCLAAKGTSRPVIMCKRVAKELGEVTRFAAGDALLDAADLAKCNGE